MEQKDLIEEQYNEFKNSKIKFEPKKNAYNVKNYLDVKLGPNETEKEIVVRLINISPDISTPFKEVHTHFLPSAKKSYICSKNTRNTPEGTETTCPFCDIRDQAKEELRTATGVKAEKLKEIRNQNTSMVNFIVRVIDRNDQSFGPKFWKISPKHYEDIHNIYKMHKKHNINIYDVNDGKDLTVIISKENGKNKIKSIIADITTSPLAQTQEEIDRIINDDKKWYEMFGIKPYGYLDLLINGEEPWFDSKSKTWVSKKNHMDDQHKSESEQEEIDSAVTSRIEREFSNRNNDSEEQDDLPF